MSKEEYFKLEMPGGEMFAFLTCIEEAVHHPNKDVKIVEGSVNFRPQTDKVDDLFTFRIPIKFIGIVVETLSNCADEPSLEQKCIASTITLVSKKDKRD